MSVEGFAEYKRREFCKDVKCRVQMELNESREGSPDYENTRKKCSSGCLYTTWQFHHWLIEKNFLLLVSTKLKEDETTVLVDLDKEFVDWVDQQVKNGRFKDRKDLIETALSQFKHKPDK